ncbi:MAG: DUF3305 domain-containing protein [Candidatus Thiodiazotropha sp. (ex Monitilora ramsayi)]|nr:DUF3305 domain-containing protein [Candidatus Thiodiazotropha sp. (ex Monitilora ramsayi)]
MSLRYADEVGEALPDTFAISIIMQESPSESPWLASEWEAVGILAGELREDDECQDAELVMSEGGIKQYLYRGFTIRLHVDECESYYHNLMSPSPHAYIVANTDDSERPLPMMVSLSFDEAHAYLEGDENLYTVPIPPEIYQWIEAFILAHYVPVKRTKRKRQDWRHQAQGNRR